MPPKKQKDDLPMTAPLSSGGTGPVSAVGGMNTAERVAQVRALQAMSPFQALDPAVTKLDVNKGFELGEVPFKLRESTMASMKGSVEKIRAKLPSHVFNQHVEGLTFFNEGQERPRFNVATANTQLFSVEQALGFQGGAYDKEQKFKPPKKGVVE